MRFFIFIILSAFSITASAQDAGEKAMNARPDKCFELCYIPSVWKIREIEVPVYIGPEDDMVIEREAQFFTADTGEEMRILTVLDRSKTNFYTIKKFSKRVLLRKGDFEEWREVLCSDKLSSEMIQQIQKVLIAEDFLPQGYVASEDFEPEFKNAIIDFQKKYSLPIGYFDFETLDALDVNYEN